MQWKLGVRQWSRRPSLLPLLKTNLVVPTRSDLTIEGLEQDAPNEHYWRERERVGFSVTWFRGERERGQDFQLHGSEVREREAGHSVTWFRGERERGRDFQLHGSEVRERGRDFQLHGLEVREREGGTSSYMV